MKNLNRIYFMATATLAFVLVSLIPVDGNAQGKNKEQTLAAFPENVSGIFSNSCVGCHSDQSRGKAKEFMNLSEWDKLTPKKQHKEAKSIAKIVRKGEMPPAQFLEKRPEAALTPVQAAAIATWAKAIPKK